jgi:Na+/melibiose symporter-like transporter
MTFARKSSSALVIFLFSMVLQFTGYNEAFEVQPDAAQNGIKYVMAFTCIIFMVLGFVMAKKYVLSKEKSQKVEKYLALAREGKLDDLTPDECAELEALKKSLS